MMKKQFPHACGVDAEGLNLLAILLLIKLGAPNPALHPCGSRSSLKLTQNIYSYKTEPHGLSMPSGKRTGVHYRGSVMRVRINTLNSLQNHNIIKKAVCRCAWWQCGSRTHAAGREMEKDAAPVLPNEVAKTQSNVAPIYGRSYLPCEP